MNGELNTHDVLHLFERQVERDPDAIATTSSHGELTYRDLNHLAEMLAGQLRSCGVGEEMVVGLCVPRSPAMLVEAQIAFEELLRLQNWALEPGLLTWRTNLTLRGLTALPITFTPALQGGLSVAVLRIHPSGYSNSK